MKRIVASAAAVIMAGFLTACGAASAPHASAPTAPSPTTIAGWLGCALAPYSDINTQDAYDTVAYDSLTAPGDSGSPCSVGTGEASDVITFATQAKEIDWLHQNDLAQSGVALVLAMWSLSKALYGS